jgi:hypothetical protein
LVGDEDANGRNDPTYLDSSLVVEGLDQFNVALGLLGCR